MRVSLDSQESECHIANYVKNIFSVQLSDQTLGSITSLSWSQLCHMEKSPYQHYKERQSSLPKIIRQAAVDVGEVPVSEAQVHSSPSEGENTRMFS